MPAREVFTVTYVKTPVRLALLAPGGIALIAGLDAALLLLGLPAPVTFDRLPDVHGPLLVLGFAGTVIALERAVALRAGWGYAAPAALGLGGIALITPVPLAVGQVLLLLGTVGQLVVYRSLWRRQESVALAMQVLGAILAAGSALLWWGGAPVATVLPWFAGFLVLTIAGERLELARVGALEGGGRARRPRSGRARRRGGRGRDAVARRRAHPARGGAPGPGDPAPRDRRRAAAGAVDGPAALHGLVPARRLRLAGRRGGDLAAARLRAGRSRATTR